MRSMPMACPTRVLSLAAAGLLAAGPAVASEAGPAMRLGAVEAPPRGFLELCSRQPEHCTAAAAPSATDLDVLRQQASRAFFSLAFGRPLPDAPAPREAPAAGPAIAAPSPLTQSALTQVAQTQTFTALRPGSGLGAGFGRVAPAPAPSAADAPAAADAAARALEAPAPVPVAAPVAAPVEALAAADLARPAVARVRAPEAAPVTLDRADWRRVQRINREVNRAIRHREDSAVYGRPDQWALGEAGVGDCEDYALAKRAALIQAGVPARALSIALVETRRGESHAVLLIDTDKGALVLDNLSPWIRRWDQTPYTWIARQTPGDPLTWRAVEA
ncbi:MAG: transglutaminase-like cysteine peptidase [Brevundimonas sp.]|uniref:transglutaminase-like cysteine peptidase n=2 Tax=Brevundimonas sp. TaxID=1871086 RepID=UPI00391F8086